MTWASLSCTTRLPPSLARTMSEIHASCRSSVPFSLKRSSSVARAARSWAAVCMAALASGLNVYGLGMLAVEVFGVDRN